MEGTLPARTVSAASQVACQAGSEVGKCGRGGAGDGEGAGGCCAGTRDDGMAAAPAASAVCLRKSRRKMLLFMRTSVRPGDCRGIRLTQKCKTTRFRARNRLTG